MKVPEQTLLLTLVEQPRGGDEDLPRQVSEREYHQLVCCSFSQAWCTNLPGLHCP